ncbi:hypothetical protein C2S52_023432 [Perilla frutescens var. hirtella]|nr:hypothetical protein C2S52_023432 [Perilla frutescens var. hirtella]
MNALIWNARCLGSTRAFMEFRRLMADQAPCLVFICETKIHVVRCGSWKSRFQLESLFGVDSVGASGGLLLIWKTPLDVMIKSYSQGHTDCTVRWQDKFWQFTGFYGNPDCSLRTSSWDLIRKLARGTLMDQLPWLVGGDFNEILLCREKQGG